MSKNIDVTNTITKIQEEHPELLVYLDDENGKAADIPGNELNEKSEDGNTGTDLVYHKSQSESDKTESNSETKESECCCSGECNAECCKSDDNGAEEVNQKNCMECEYLCMADAFDNITRGINAVNMNIIELCKITNSLRNISTSKQFVAMENLKASKIKGVSKKHIKRLEKKLRKDMNKGNHAVVDRLNDIMSELRKLNRK